LCPDIVLGPDGINHWYEKAYLSDILSSHAAFMVDYLTNIATTNFKALGVLAQGFANNETCQSWQQAYIAGAVANCYKQTADPNWLTVANHAANRFVSALSAPAGVLNSANYQTLIRLTTTGDFCTPADMAFTIGSQIGDQIRFGINQVGQTLYAGTLPTATW